MKGGKIGEFPAFSDKYIPGGKHFSSECIQGLFNFFPLCNSIATLSKSCKIIIGALNYYDPFGWHKNRSEEAKANGLVKEINNGRLAMLGIFGFLCEQTIPGSVPGLSGIVQPYSGEVMAPLAKSILPTL